MDDAGRVCGLERLRDLERDRRDLGRRRVDEAIAIYERGGLPQEPDHLSRSLTLQGSIQIQQGDVEAARTTFSEALAVRERLFGAAHPLSAESRRDLATTQFIEGSYPAAVRAALDAETTGREHLQFTIRYLPERQAMAYADKRPRGLDLAVSSAASPPPRAFRRSSEMRIIPAARRRP